jgi:hypothetical protein
MPGQPSRALLLNFAAPLISFERRQDDPGRLPPEAIRIVPGFGPQFDQFEPVPARPLFRGFAGVSSFAFGKAPAKAADIALRASILPVITMSPASAREIFGWRS